MWKSSSKHPWLKWMDLFTNVFIIEFKWRARSIEWDNYTSMLLSCLPNLEIRFSNFEASHWMSINNFPRKQQSETKNLFLHLLSNCFIIKPSFIDHRIHFQLALFLVLIQILLLRWKSNITNFHLIIELFWIQIYWFIHC